MADQIPFHQLLAKLMAENRISQSELARRTGINRSRINEYLSGKSRPRPDKLRLLYAALDYDPDDDERPTPQMLEAASKFYNEPSRKAANERKREILLKINKLNDDNQVAVLRIIDALLYQQDNDKKEDYPF